MLIEEIKDIPEKEVKNFLIDEGEIFQTLVSLKESGFNLLIDIFAVDYPNHKERHEVIYLLLSIKLNKRVALKVKIREGRSLPSSVEIFKTAGWLEREVFDMYGIKFLNNPDLRRILTDYNFEGHPMLKDFPLSGYKEVRYDVEAREVVYDNVNLVQDYRSFDFLSPWEGTLYKKG